MQRGEAVKVALVVNTCGMCAVLGAMRVNLHLRNPHDSMGVCDHCSILQVMKLKDREVFFFF